MIACMVPIPSSSCGIGCLYTSWHVFLSCETPHLGLCHALPATHLEGQQALLCCLQLSSALLRRSRQSERQ